MDISLLKLREDAESIIIENTSYIRSYPHLLSFFSSRSAMDEPTFVAAAHMVYGWMRTTLRLGDGSLSQGAKFLSRALLPNASLGEDELAQLMELMNRSIVGASKLLHFANPSCFAILDSQVYFYIHGEVFYHHLGTPTLYLEYVDALKRVTSDPAYSEIDRIVKGKLPKLINGEISYSITPLRSAELIMFLKAKKDAALCRHAPVQLSQAHAADLDDIRSFRA